MPMSIQVSNYSMLSIFFACLQCENPAWDRTELRRRGITSRATVEKGANELPALFSGRYLSQRKKIHVAVHSPCELTKEIALCLY